MPQGQLPGTERQSVDEHADPWMWDNVERRQFRHHIGQAVRRMKCTKSCASEVEVNIELPLHDFEHFASLGELSYSSQASSTVKVARARSRRWRVSVKIATSRLTSCISRSLTSRASGRMCRARGFRSLGCLTRGWSVSTMPTRPDKAVGNSLFAKCADQSAC